jgi:hypothetical protein
VYPFGSIVVVEESLIPEEPWVPEQSLIPALCFSDTANADSLSPAWLSATSHRLRFVELTECLGVDG